MLIALKVDHMQTLLPCRFSPSYSHISDEYYKEKVKITLLQEDIKKINDTVTNKHSMFIFNRLVRKLRGINLPKVS